MRVALLLIGLSLNTAASARVWVPLAATATDGTEYEMDTESIRRNGDIATVWIKADLSKVRSTRARSKTQLWKYNCRNSTNFIASSVTYGADGGVISSNVEQEYDFKYEPTVPDTIGDFISNIVCDLDNAPNQ